MSSDLAAAAKPKPYTLAPTQGGRHPEIGELFSASMAEFTDHLGDYVMLGLGQMLIVFPATFALIFVLYLGMSIVMFGGLFGSALAAAVATEGMGEDIGGLVGLGGSAVTMVVGLVALFALILAFAALIAPVTASCSRAVARHQRGGGKLTLQDAFSTFTQDLGAVFAAAAILVTGTLVGMMFCYVPGIAFAMLLSMAPLLVYVHRKPAVAAFAQAYADLRANPSWHLQFALVYFAVAMVASYVPILGPMFLTTLHVRAFREVYGDEPAPA